MAETRNPLYVDWGKVVDKLDDTVLLCGFLAAVIIPLCHMLLHRFVITPLGRKWLKVLPEKKTDESQEAGQKRLLKFQESAWKCFVYIALSAGSAYALRNETFWRKTSGFWTGCTAIPCQYQATPEINFAYALDMAYYVYAIPYCILFETKRKDFWATMTHHIATVALIGFSYALGFTKCGVVVMFLHDICDSPLEMAKMAKYANREALTNALFVFFAVLWICMRDVYYPLYVIHSVLVESKPMVVGHDRYIVGPHFEIFASLLCFLWALHVYWTYLILRIALKALSDGSADDDREDDD